MPLTPPPDYSKAILCAAGGVAAALILGVYTRSTLPFVGDQAHSLPHGGFYRDGTKAVFYGSAGRLNSIEGTRNLVSQPWALVLLLSALIFLSHRFSTRCVCGRDHNRC